MVLEDELSSLNRELCMFPTRAFEFKHAGTVIIEQDVADVGSVVWDAEVLLAHYLDLAYGPRLMRGRRVVELGAGTGLAGIVAARLGASVLLTDQAKLLPTLVNNARSNAGDLELRSPLSSPPPSTSRSTDTEDEPTKGALAASDGALAGVAEAPSRQDAARNASLQSHSNEGVCDGTIIGGGKGGSSRERGGGGGSVGELPLRKRHPGEEGSPKLGGTWRAAELLFSRNEDEVLRSAVSGREEEESASPPPVPGDDGLFDLVIAADVVYLRDLWDELAATIKTLLKPSGEAIMAFEQRRSNVEAFFGPPRFGHSAADGLQLDFDCCWEQGREVDLEREVARGQGLGNAARATRVRLFRMAPRKLSGS